LLELAGVKVTRAEKLNSQLIAKYYTNKRENLAKVGKKNFFAWVKFQARVGSLDKIMRLWTWLEQEWVHLPILNKETSGGFQRDR